MMLMILMLTFLFIFMRFHGWHLTAELPLGERAPWHPPCLESHRGFEWVAVPWDAKLVIFMLGAPFQWQTICSFFGAKQTLQIQGCTALTTVLLVLLFGWGVWPHSHFLDVVAIPQNTRGNIVASFPSCVDSSLMDWIYGPSPTIGSVWRKC